jgi:tetratricopeptide (TPR) repeat protein
MVLLNLAAMLLAAQSASAAPSPSDGSRDPGRIVTAIGYYSGVDADARGARLQLDDTPLRFRLPRLSVAEEQRWIQVVAAAAERGFALRVRFDGNAGSVDAASATVTYPLCSLSVGDVTPLGDETANCPVSTPSNGRGSFTALARGAALSRYHARASLRLLGEALGDRNLPPSLRAMALRLRADNDEALAFDLEYGSDAFDRLMIAALADDRERVTLEPDVVEAHYSVAFALTELGALDDALTILAGIKRRWPEEGYRASVRIGAVHRHRGDYRRALAELDDFAARAGRPEGMRFAYHRAWTLMTMGRYADALVEIEIGLRAQADYASAWQIRSCAHAGLGNIGEARSDQQRALELFESMSAGGEPSLGREIARSRRLVETLQATQGRASAETLDLACREPWGNWTRSRSRSPLLPPATS